MVSRISLPQGEDEPAAASGFERRIRLGAQSLGLEPARRTQRPALEVRRELAQELRACRGGIEQRIDADDARLAAVELADRHLLSALYRRDDDHYAPLA